ncbi:proline iminopeptidase-family hydrolase [Streptomyces sp. DSM 44915]|uniref:Proline iminopeptidase n=1 Tax=Streptomyces chisholmiae TaxID=3075540 RepID=A0ABU2JW85_9ACTN|nr:proline iminopeptidase-family hydrolase [Streptomyces sp. DSM 44915]MDT0269260.1 proline iminopeptidase-family hydrolase [Streptomyces sp. DSM 44915]
MTPAASSKGTVQFGAYRTWYRVTGDLAWRRPTLVVMHGGPGATHDCMLPLAALAEDGWPVVHYDQLGNGGSTHLPDQGADFWTVELFERELTNLVERLGIADDYVLFGQSWGGMLGAVHAARRPAGLKGLVIANSPVSMPDWLVELARLRKELDPATQEALACHEAAGTTDTTEYFQAMKVFYDHFVCRVDWPPEFTATFLEIQNNPTVYYTMNGPSEFHVTGTLKDWSVAELLPRIAVPTLVVSGRHDECTPDSVRPFQELIPDARWEIFENSSHVPQFEEPELLRSTLIDYLTTLGDS